MKGEKTMTKRGVIKLFSVTAGLAVVCVAKYISNKGYDESLQEIRDNRSEADEAVFKAYNDVSHEVASILAKEELQADKQYNAAAYAYNDAVKKVNDILAKERAMEQMEYKAATKAFEEVEIKATAITSNEETLVKDILKSDDAYQALKSARKVLKKNDESTDKIDIKIANRKEAIKNSVISSRSKEDVEIFEELERLRKRMMDSTTRESDIVKSRSEEDWNVFKERDIYKANLRSLNDIKRDIAKNRTDEENDIFNRKSELLGLINDIQNREADTVDTEQAFADKLSRMGFGKAGVFVLGTVPVIPVVIFTVDYMNWLINLTKKM